MAPAESSGSGGELELPTGIRSPMSPWSVCVGDGETTCSTIISVRVEFGCDYFASPAAFPQSSLSRRSRPHPFL